MWEKDSHYDKHADYERIRKILKDNRNPCGEIPLYFIDPYGNRLTIGEAATYVHQDKPIENKNRRLLLILR